MLNDILDEVIYVLNSNEHSNKYKNSIRIKNCY